MTSRRALTSRSGGHGSMCGMMALSPGALATDHAAVMDGRPHAIAVGFLRYSPSSSRTRSNSAQGSHEQNDRATRSSGREHQASSGTRVDLLGHRAPWGSSFDLGPHVSLLGLHRHEERWNAGLP